ncbi:hypothetical protein EDB80DRAFT_825163 [Ilyonectria destructans]|nr:hypothetical protein EDB80DRAFT_825163 [Ilyonectria destructans]
MGIGIANRYLNKIFGLEEGDGDGKIEEDGLVDSIFDVQAGHRSHIAGLAYARLYGQGDLGTIRSRDEFRKVRMQCRGQGKVDGGMEGQQWRRVRVDCGNERIRIGSRRAGCAIGSSRGGSAAFAKFRTGEWPRRKRWEGERVDRGGAEVMVRRAVTSLWALTF